MSVRKCDRNEGNLQVLNLSLRQCTKIKRYYKELTGRDYE